jgi:FkbH-like protein
MVAHRSARPKTSSRWHFQKGGFEVPGEIGTSPAPAAHVRTATFDRLALDWLPPRTASAEEPGSPARALNHDIAWHQFVRLANTRMDFIRTASIDRQLKRSFPEMPPSVATKPVRLAVLGSSTVSHLLPAIRVAALRRGLWGEAYEPDYGQYLQELSEAGSALFRFSPNVVLFALDARHVLGGIDPAAERAEVEARFSDIERHLLRCWRLARDAFRCQVIQQTILPVFPGLLGSNEHRLPGSPRHLVMRLNSRLRELAEEHGIDLLAVDEFAAEDGIRRWHDPVLWHHAKQEISPVAAPFYGESVARLVAAQQGRSAKCLALDLDNTLWGGVIGDDGLDGIVLGQGSALGEAFVDLQAYARNLMKRGVILAVCSKNDPEIARSAFAGHPDMVLKETDISAFVANWDDKATNLRRIAKQLNIGLDSLVFLDDNPFERNLVRRELPEVAVPEVPDDPALIPAVLSAAGYFEGLAVTEEDRERTAQYGANREREVFQAETTDLSAYLAGLRMELVWRHFDNIGLPRIVQLINKTNQFNLTTQRYGPDEVAAVMQDPRAVGLQFRLVDRFGDNGVIAIVIGRMADDEDLLIDTWLMSCRVLGRGVESATLAVVAAEAKQLGARRMVGIYRPTGKNGIVRDHYARLGFTSLEQSPEDVSRWVMRLTDLADAASFIAVRQG